MFPFLRSGFILAVLDEKRAGPSHNRLAVVSVKLSPRTRGWRDPLTIVFVIYQFNNGSMSTLSMRREEM